jgi:hypothetical protein
MIMVKRGLFVGLMLLALGVLAHANAAEKSPVTSINKNDHSGLVTYYAEEAKELREKAKHWDMVAEVYEKHQEPAGKTSAAEHAAHCRTIAKDYRQAGDEADALATEHRAMLPHGRVQ